jgi:dephospho-CoA kinase
MIKIGLTGGIGSGKTTVAKIFEVLGIPVYYADDRAKELMQSNENIKTQIIHSFGADSFVDGKLNRKHIAALVFANPENTAIINSIVHPVTIADANEWMLKQNTHYAIKEAALIFEAKAEKQLDYIIGVNSTLPLRIQRIMQRDNMDEAAVMARMQKQMDAVEKMKRCHFVVENNEVDLLIPQVLAIHQKILEKRKTSQ